jgi:ribosomal protein L9
MDLETGIKTIGLFKVNINLHAEIQANILIQVEKLEENKI